jgi:hypothetical protein
VKALEEAISTYERRGNLDRQQRFDAAVSLGEWGVYSASQIATIVDLPKAIVAKVIGKKDRTGGRLTIESLEPLLRLAQLNARGEVDVMATKAALDAGASRRMASKLTGWSEGQLRRQMDRAEKLGKETA